MSDLLKKAPPVSLCPTGVIISRDLAKGDAPVYQLVDGFGGKPIGKCPTQPSDKALTSDQLREVAGIGGVGISGTGELAGTIALVKKGVVNFGIATLSEVPMLVTANRGNSNEVSFELDISGAQARALQGQDVSVSGLIEKHAATMGKITGAKIEGSDGFPSGTWKSIRGTVENVPQLSGIGGESAPGGSYLVLGRPIDMGGQKFDRVRIDNKQLPQGATVDLTGRLDKKSWGGVARPRVDYVELTGVTNQTAGEPKTTDGETFTSTAGKPLQVVSYDRPNMYDGPSTLYVFDQGADQAWVGERGVYQLPGSNPFRGFHDSRAIEVPTLDDRAVIGTNDVGRLIDKQSGEELVLLSERDQGLIPDGMHTGWYRNERSGDVYRIQNGGLAGFRNHMDQIIRSPQGGRPAGFPPL